MTTVYVLSKDGKPLMPTTRCGHVRILLKEGKARVFERKPFTIQLNYETAEITQSLYLGIDPGRTNIGVSIVTEAGESVFSAQLVTRNKDVPKLMKARKEYRAAHRRLKRRTKRQRRAKAAGTTVAGGIVDRILPGCEKPIHCKEIKNKEARFNNRKRPEGWLTPTANHLLLTHLNLVKKLQKFLPITDVVLEVNKFAFMAMDNPNIQRWQYQQGQLYGLGSVENAVFSQQGGTCIFCDRKIDRYHHVVPKSKGGSETLENRVGLCENHHRLVHTEELWTTKLTSKKTGLNKKYHALSVLNQIIPFLENELGTMFPNHAFITTGQDTAAFREDYGIPKNHHLDAYCIACSVLTTAVEITVPEQPVLMSQFRRHDRQACHQQNGKRVYLLDGKAVATNRNKAMEQKDDSLVEFRKTHDAAEMSRLTVKPHSPAYKDMERVMPGATMLFENSLFVLQRSDGRHNGVPDYYISAVNTRYSAKKCNIIQNNKGIAITG